MVAEGRSREVRVVTPVPGAAPEIGVWLWAMEETRRGLLDTVAGLDQEALEWQGPDSNDNAIGALLYHIALVEMSWLYEDTLLEPLPDDIAALFPVDHRSEDGRLAQVEGVPLAEHLERLAVTRRRFLERMGGLSVEEWNRTREPEGVDYAVSPAWMVFHLVEHEAGHTFQMRQIKRSWDQTLP